MIFPEDRVEPRAVLEFRVELLPHRFRARPLAATSPGDDTKRRKTASPTDESERSPPRKLPRISSTAQAIGTCKVGRSVAGDHAIL